MNAAEKLQASAVLKQLIAKVEKTIAAKEKSYIAKKTRPILIFKNL